VSRQEPSVAAAPPADLHAFPVWHVLRGTVLHRVTDAGRGPWWFASDGEGRFDLPPPRGTCYLADDPLVALLEALGPAGSAPVLAASVLDGRVVWSVALPDQCDAADLTARGARRFGVTAELAASTPYPTAQRWAAALAAAGYDGLRYRARHDPAGGRCLALFGAAGERRRWRRGRPAPVAATLAGRLRDEAGIVVEAARPSERALRDVRD
jgi:hypothetical protein